MSIKRILDQPRTGVACRRCGKHLGLYLVRGEHHSLCAPCTKARIDAYAVEPSERPSWVTILYDEILHQLRYEERQEKQCYTVSWDLVKCSACGRMMKRCDARYRFPEVDESEVAPERNLTPAQQSPDGTLLVFPSNRVPEIHHPVCVQCYKGH